MKELIRMWKKGAAFAAIGFGLSWLISIMGFKVFNSIESFRQFAWTMIVSLILTFVVLPLVNGFLIEWINKKIRR